MIVGLDIDGVLADFITPFLHLLAERTGTGPIDPVSVIDPNFIAHPFLTPTMIFDCMEAASYDAEFWRALTPLLTPKQWRELDRVSRTHQTVFITHRWVRDTYDINRVTCDWLQCHGVSNPVVYFSELGIGLFVDDRHENCHDVASETEAVVFMPHRPYNQAFDHPKVRRIQQLEELFEYLADK